jgi:hypothetical protein
MQHPVEHGRSQRLVVGEGRNPRRERQVACQHLLPRSSHLATTLKNRLAARRGHKSCLLKFLSSGQSILNRLN